MGFLGISFLFLFCVCLHTPPRFPTTTTNKRKFYQRERLRSPYTVERRYRARSFLVSVYFSFTTAIASSMGSDRIGVHSLARRQNHTRISFSLATTIVAWRRFENGVMSSDASAARSSS